MWQCIECDHENPRTLDACEKCSTHRPPSSLIGEQISQWVIEEELGEGGMAVVFQAKHVMLGSPVAIKILRADLMHKREVVERFRTEALAASHLRHDNVIQVHDFGSQKGVGVYMVLEFLEGMDLEEKIEDQQMPLGWSMSIAKQICSGLEVAHNAGIIHRDLKPSNIYLVPRKDQEIPLAKILDFGIAKIQESQLFEGQNQNLTRTGTVLGTPYYLSPEQLRRRDKQELGPSVDIYAFGVILYQMLAGRLPIEEPTLAEQMAAILTRKPPLIGEFRPELSGTSFELLLHRLLAKKPEERPGSIGEVWQELEKAAGALNDPSVDAALRQQWKQTYKTPDIDDIPQQPSFMARYGVTVALMLLLLVGGSVLAYVLFRKDGTTPPPKRRAEIRKVALPGWLDLRNRGAKAYKSNNYLEAIKLWRQSLAGLQKSGTKGKQLSQQSRVLLQSIGIAAQKSNRNYAALHFLKQLAKAPGLTQKEKDALDMRIRSLRNGLADDKKSIKLIQEIIKNNLKSKNYKGAFKAFQKLFDTPDKSLPIPLEKAGDQLKKLVPSLALSYYKRANKLALTPDDKKRTKGKLDALNNKIKEQRQSLTGLLGPNAKINGKTRKALRKAFLAQPGDLVLHKQVMKRSLSLFATNPNQAVALLRTYRRTLKEIQKKPAWVWLQPLAGKRIPSDTQLKAAIAVARKERGALRQITRSNRRAASHIKRNKMGKALEVQQEKWTSLGQIWDKIGNVGGPLKTFADDAKASTGQNAIQNKKMLDIWQQIKAKHELNQLSKADPQFKELLGLTKDKQTLTEGFTKAHLAWQKRHARAASYLQKGEQSAKKRWWSACKQQFNFYLQLYPKAHNKEDVKLKRCKCRCKLPAPFEPCSEQCKLPYK